MNPVYGQLAGQSVGYENQFQNAAAPAPASPIDRLLSALNTLEQATQMALSTTDALCGSQPSGIEGGKAATEPAPSGLFGAINLSAARVERMATAIIESMGRIQRVAG